eukprot:CAMPEP_0195057254 /NCGR_PEP_ID=MMETSP0448-20130528/5417_1 /TAXON_ID=66468 /ORGANISM="Heterocapsa triquestra, Strain CCMP 448" /LENGTH=46 /DNA_ID= /DNA_START= /DNA_END= /DNA_ORIENTATION=
MEPAVPQQEADVARSLLEDAEAGITPEVERQPTEGVLQGARIGLGR